MSRLDDKQVSFTIHSYKCRVFQILSDGTSVTYCGGLFQSLTTLL